MEIQCGEIISSARSKKSEVDFILKKNKSAALPGFQHFILNMIQFFFYFMVTTQEFICLILQKCPHTYTDSHTPVFPPVSDEEEEDQSKEPDPANKNAALFIIPFHHHPPCFNNNLTNQV